MSSAVAPFHTVPDWHGDTPATLAVVIGVSGYDHLTGGSGAPTPDSYGLGQLYVSALTAYRFADWLRGSFRVRDCPLTRCWLLVSPTSAEIAEQPALADVPGRPTFEQCEAVIGEWFQAASMLTAVAAAKSRLVFFFTGHGLELEQDEQLLLPSDYLRPPLSLMNRALSTRNLRHGMAVSTVPTQLFFLDACRNDHSRMRQRGLRLRGTEVLNEPAGAFSHPDLDAPVIYGASTGTQAYQPITPHAGLTLYGSALLEGLTSPPRAYVDCEDGACRLHVSRLVEWMSRRVAQLISDHGANVQQRVRTGGSSGPLVVVTEVAQQSLTDTDPPAVAVSERRRRTASVALPDAGSGAFQGGTSGDDVFGDARMADTWQEHRLVEADSSTGAPHRLLRVDRQDTRVYDLALRIDGRPVTHHLEVPDEDVSFCSRLPWLGVGARYALRVVRDDAGAVATVSASVDVENRGVLGSVGRAWSNFEQGSGAAAAGLLPDAALRDSIEGAADSPLPLIVAALLRLRLREPVAPGWLADAALFYPSWTDLSVLASEQQLRDGHQLSAESVTTIVRGLAAGPDPLTRGALSLAWDLVTTLRRRLGLYGTATAELEALHNRLDRLLVQSVAEGLFVTTSKPSWADPDPDPRPQ